MSKVASFKELATMIAETSTIEKGKGSMEGERRGKVGNIRS